MTIAEFSWQTALLGGVLIGLAAVTLMVTIGRVAGISGILAATLRPSSSLPWQWAFVAGLLLSGVAVYWLYRPIELQIESSTPMLILAGLLVGFGTRLGSGCTSGHGVCGISNLSPRSMVATAIFMGVGMLTVFLWRLLRYGVGY